MSQEDSVEQRLVALEASVAVLQRILTTPPVAVNWLEKITGTFKDEPAFEEVVRLGRAFRDADRPSDEEEAAP